MKKPLLLLLFPLSLFGQAVSTRNFDTNYFQVRTNVSPYDITINTNAGSAASSWVTNLSGGPQVWTNDGVGDIILSGTNANATVVAIPTVSTNTNIRLSYLTDKDFPSGQITLEAQNTNGDLSFTTMLGGPGSEELYMQRSPGAVAMDLWPGQVDSPGVILNLFNTFENRTQATGKLLSVQNNGVERFYIGNLTGRFGLAGIDYLAPITNSLDGQVMAIAQPSHQLYWTNLSAGGGSFVDLWTNDTVAGAYGSLRALRPVDQTRTVAVNVTSTNNQAFTSTLTDTNPAHTYTLAGYFEDKSTNSGSILYYQDGNHGLIGESDANNGAIRAGEGVGVFGVGDSHFYDQFGVAGLASAQFNNQTNYGVAGSGTSNGKTGTKRIGVYAETVTTAPASTANPLPAASAVFAGDSRDTGDTLLRLSTNNGTTVFSVNATGDPVVPGGASADKVLTDSDGVGTGRWKTFPSTAGQTNAIQSLITNSINQNARIGPGTLNQIAKFVNPTNVGDSILSEVSQQFVDLKAGSATPDGSQDALLRIFDNYTNATGYKDLRLGWKVGNGEFEIATEQGSGVATSVPILTLGSGGVQWGIAATTDHAFYPLGDDTTSMGGVSGRIHAFYLGTLGIQATTGSKVFSYGNAGGMSGSALVLSVNDSSAVEQFRFDSTSGPRLDLGPNKLVLGPSINAPDIFLSRLSSGILSISTNNTGSGAGQLAGIQGGNGSGTDKAAGSVTINGGAPTGSGRAGDVLITTSTNGATGSSPRGFQSRIFVSAHEAALTESSATLVANITVPSKAYLGITVTATTHADDGTDFQSVHEIFSVAAVSKSGTVTTSISASSPMATVQSSGTLTTTWTAVANGNSVDLKCNAVSSLTQTTLSTKWIIDINSDGPAVVTAQ